MNEGDTVIQVCELISIHLREGIAEEEEELSRSSEETREALLEK